MKGKTINHAFDRARNAVVLSVMLAFALSASANAVVIQDRMSIENAEIPIHRWQDPMVATRGLVVLLHGFTMNGAVYENLAHHLAKQGLLVVAPDMRGFGEWYQKSKDSEVPSEIDYDQSEKDISALVKELRDRYPEMPVFIAGESLGASMAIRYAAKHDHAVDGLILSSPSVKYIPHPSFKMARQLFGAAIKKHGAVDLTFYVKKYYSNDERITDEGISNVEMRKNVGIKDLLKTRRVVKDTQRYIKMIPASMPVLVLQGSEDRMVKAKGVRLLAESLKSNDKTIEWLSGSGHIVLETQYMRSDSMKIVTNWLSNHVKERTAPGVSVATRAPQKGLEPGHTLAN